MASTLTTRVAVGTVLFLGCAVATLIIWRKINKGHKQDSSDEEVSNESGISEKSDTDDQSQMSQLSFVQERETISSKVNLSWSSRSKCDLRQTLNDIIVEQIKENKNLQLEKVTLRCKVTGKESDREKVSKVLHASEMVFQFCDANNDIDKFHVASAIDKMVDHLFINVIPAGRKSSPPRSDKDDQVKSSAKTSNQSAFEKQDEEESEKVRAASDSRTSRDTGQHTGDTAVVDSVTYVPTPKGDNVSSQSEAAGENYVCENGVCRLVKPGSESHTKNTWHRPNKNGDESIPYTSTTRGASSSLEESLTKSLDQFFKEGGSHRMDDDSDDNEEEAVDKVITAEQNMNFRNSEESLQSPSKELIPTQPEKIKEEVKESSILEQANGTATCQASISDNALRVEEKTEGERMKPEASHSHMVESEVQEIKSVSQNQAAALESSLPESVSEQNKQNQAAVLESNTPESVSEQNKQNQSAALESSPPESVSEQNKQNQAGVSQETSIYSSPESVSEQTSEVKQANTASTVEPVSVPSEAVQNLGLVESCQEIVAEEEVKEFSQQDMADAILVSQNSPGLLSSANVEVLVSLLSHPNDQMQMSALNGIKKSSSFIRNQNLFREHGCIPKLSQLLTSQIMSLRRGVTSSQNVITAVNTTITNLATNEENHKRMEDCMPPLVDLALEDETGEAVCLSSLQALTNLSLTDQYHGHYTRLVQRLYDFLDTDQNSIKLQALKVLVNLSCSVELVPHILAAKAPACLMDVLKQGADEALLLRMTTFLANILQTVKKENISVSSLPPDDKAASPETMYSALYGINNIGHLKSKVFLLSRHRNTDIRFQASRIYQSIAK